MNGIFASIVGLLQQELDLHQELLELARQEQRDLVSGSVQDLAKVVQEQEERIYKIRSLESARLELVEMLARKHGLKPEELTLSRLASLADEETANRFSRLQRAMVQVLQELSVISKANALLAQQALGYTRTLLEILSKEEGAYDPQGKGTRRSILVDREA